MTPLSPLPFLGYTLTLPDAVTVVELDPQPFSNTREVLLLNLSSTDRIFVQVVNLASGLPVAGDVILTNSTVIPSSGAVHLCIGVEGSRMPLGTVAFWAANPGSKLGIVLRAETGAAPFQVNVTLVQSVGGGDGKGC
jgi:hypothetical protein